MREIMINNLLRRQYQSVNYEDRDSLVIYFGDQSAVYCSAVSEDLEDLEGFICSNICDKVGIEFFERAEGSNYIWYTSNFDEVIIFTISNDKRALFLYLNSTILGFSVTCKILNLFHYFMTNYEKDHMLYTIQIDSEINYSRNTKFNAKSSAIDSILKFIRSKYNYYNDLK